MVIAPPMGRLNLDSAWGRGLLVSSTSTLGLKTIASFSADPRKEGSIIRHWIDG